MIVDAFLSLLTWLINTVTDPLPVATFVFPTYTEALDLVGQYAGPLDTWAPLHEAATAAVFMVTMYLPLALIYMLVSWVYRHIPFVGGG